MPVCRDRGCRDENGPLTLAAIGAAVEAGQLDEHGLSRFWDHADPAQPGGDRVAELIADGAGRRRLARELGISEYEARQLLDRTRTDSGSPDSGSPDSGTGTTQDAVPDRVPAVNGSRRAAS